MNTKDNVKKVYSAELFLKAVSEIGKNEKLLKDFILECENRGITITANGDIEESYKVVRDSTMIAPNYWPWG